MPLPLPLFALGLVFLALACETTPPRQSGSPSRSAEPTPSIATTPAAPPASQAAAADPAIPASLGPEVLLPTATGDDVLATVGDLVIRKQHAFERFAERDPGGARDLLDLLELDVLVAREATARGVRVDQALVDEFVKAEEESLREQVKTELRGLRYERYLQEQFGMGPAAYKQWLERQLVRRLYRELVVRLVARCHDQVEVRYIANADRGQLENLAQRVRKGANFATLALRYSTEPNRTDGGALPPFGKGFAHPVADVALQLNTGELSEVFEAESEGARQSYLVFCVRRMPGRDLEFADVKDELVDLVRNQPLTPAEFQAAAQLLRAAAESRDALQTRPAAR